MTTLKDTTTVGEVKELIQGHSDETTIRDILRNPLASPLTDKAEVIMGIVAEEHGLTVEQIKERSRKQNTVEARQVFHYFTRLNTRLSLAKIGSSTTNDHSTVSHSIKTVKNRMETEDIFYRKIKEIEKLIYQQAVEN